ncbi:hypothetical protein FUAX_53400 (plasmid) [Fulvitalea axinellae]|uniref:Helix-turn-helix domain-containing protein n=1 Tax=Fulvitalea axinellae TaxID=1182444 RepID=A0AAU9DAH4_9BACT|nr:hypothetical protein FUAX_53400 [Fulvitalea axinellae]
MTPVSALEDSDKAMILDLLLSEDLKASAKRILECLLHGIERSRKEYASMLGANYDTVRKAVTALKNEGVLIAEKVFAGINVLSITGVSRKTGQGTAFTEKTVSAQTANVSAEACGSVKPAEAPKPVTPKTPPVPQTGKAGKAEPGSMLQKFLGLSKEEKEKTDEYGLTPYLRAYIPVPQQVREALDNIGYPNLCEKTMGGYARDWIRRHKQPIKNLEVFLKDLYPELLSEGRLPILNREPRKKKPPKPEDGGESPFILNDPGFRRPETQAPARDESKKTPNPQDPLPALDLNGQPLREVTVAEVAEALSLNRDTQSDPVKTTEWLNRYIRRERKNIISLDAFIRVGKRKNAQRAKNNSRFR